jgi:4'-phosphopantetheinyl transferase
MTHHSLRLVWMSLEDFEGFYDDLLAELPPEEHARATRFQVTAARHRFVLAHSVLRRSLGSLIDTDPEDLVFSTGERGKPLLADPAIVDPPQFNLSHSGNVVVFVVGPVDVGVDVEGLREVSNATRLARRFFSPSEQSMINALDGATRDHAFLRIWTQKEAFLKATGLGVGMPLCEVETEPDPQVLPRLHAIAGDRVEAARWTLLEARVPGAVCTIAVREPAAELEVERFTPADLEAR